MSRGTFEKACNRLEQLRPDLSQTSGRRSPGRNHVVGGSPKSKHLAAKRGAPWQGARDYRADGMPWVGASGRVRVTELEQQAKVLGLFAFVHGEGTSQHLHVQSRPADGWVYANDGWSNAET